MSAVPRPGPERRSRGLTLVELLTVLAIVGLLVGMAAPSMRDLVVRDRATATANDLTAAILRARNEAVNLNACVVLCAVAPLDPGQRGRKDVKDVNGPEPQCIAGADWSGGWVAFRVPTCDAASPGPDAVQRRPVVVTAGPVPGGFTLVKTGGSTGRLMFAPGGTVRAGDAGRFDLRHRAGAPRADRGVCLNALGRTRPVPAGAEC